VGRLLGYPQRYNPIYDLEESIAVFGDATWEQVTFCAQARFLITFEDRTKAWLTGCPRRAPQNQSERQEFAAPQAPALVPSNNDTVRIEKAATKIASAVPRLEAVLQQLAAAGDHVESRVAAAAQTLRQAQKELQPTLDELETNQVRLEAVVEEYKLKENPRQTRRALANHGVSKRIADFILEHLIPGKPVPKAPTAARELQNKYATADGLDRKTVDRHYQKALPILRAAGWPERLLPTSNPFTVLSEAHVTGDGITLTILGDLPPEPRLGLAPGSFPKTIEATLDMLHPDDRQSYREAVERSQATGEPFDMNFRLPDGRGGWRWIEGRAVAVEVRDGQSVGWIFTNRDFTPQREAEAALRQSLRELETSRSEVKSGQDKLWKLAANAFSVLGEVRVTEDGIEQHLFGDSPEAKMGLAPGAVPKSIEPKIRS